MQYLGSSEQEVRKWLGQHKDDILSLRLHKAVAKHFHDTRTTVADLFFVPVQLVRSEDGLILTQLKSKCINQLNLIEAGINRILDGVGPVDNRPSID